LETSGFGLSLDWIIGGILARSLGGLGKKIN
jgi:hypothetical protein